jgi:putative flippase GtrA
MGKWEEDRMTIAGDELPGIAPVAPPISGDQARAGHRTFASLMHLTLRHRELRRILSFLAAGGISAIVTLTATSILHEFEQVPFFLAAICGTELGILVNFTVNDLVSFRDLPGHRRQLPVRLLRFHGTCAVGQSVILILSVLLHDTWHWRAVVAQSVPIVLVTSLNFTLHRFWTYRGRR